MPFLPWIGSLFTGLVSFFAEYMTKRFAIIAAVIATLITVISAFRGVIEGAIASFSIIAPTGGFLFGLGLLPDNSALCISTLMTAQSASLLYRFQSKMLEFKLRAV